MYLCNAWDNLIELYLCAFRFFVLIVFVSPLVLSCTRTHAQGGMTESTALNGSQTLPEFIKPELRRWFSPFQHQAFFFFFYYMKNSAAVGVRNTLL